MEVSELTAYAEETYGIREEYKWADFPGFSVLCHPQTGKWVALLMRQWDTETGEERARCDLKCGRDCLAASGRPYLSLPVRMHGAQWVGVAFDDTTEPETVFRLLDRAIALGKPHGYTVVLGATAPAPAEGYRDTALPFSGQSRPPLAEAVPDRLRELRRRFASGGPAAASRAQNFCRQAVFMEDYEDDVPWAGDFFCYFPTYANLTTRQLRGYFTWRAGVRRGEFAPIPASCAYLYLYELLNGVGAASPEDALQKMRDFETGFLDSGVGDKRIRAYLRRWMLEFAVLNALPPETAREVMNAELRERDDALSALRAPESRPDEEIFSALCCLGGEKLAGSPVVTNDPARGKALFAAAWRKACAYERNGKTLFALCFGEPQARAWYPLSNAVYYERERPRDTDYILNDMRSFHCRNGAWQQLAFEKLSFDRELFAGFLHEADARLRRYLKTGRYLREKPADEWAIPLIDAVIEEDRQARLEAARPKLTIDLSGLERIRFDAAATRESLLTEEERQEEAKAEEAAAPPPKADDGTGLPLDPVQASILGALLAGKDPSAILGAHHLLPSIAADAINEALFEEIGDTVLLCEGDALALVEDYAEDIARILGGNEHG